MTKLALVRHSPNVVDGSAAAADLDLSADVCIIGSGAGGAVAASVLAAAGVSVLLVEEGGYFTHEDFDMREAHVVPKLYQESMQRTTADLAIAVLQGRAVGGTTVVNWTTSFRTPEDVVDHWAKKHAVNGFKYADLVPHYEAIEARLGIHKVEESSMNANNRRFFDGCKAKGYAVETTRRNVWQCMQTGYCGMGCPVNAKRSMLVTTIPDAIDAGAKLLFRCRVDRLESGGGEVRSAQGTLLDAGGYTPTGKRATLRAKRFILAGGAINGPALLLRSGLDSGGIVGTRTFLHPVIGATGLYDEPIQAFSGAPQSAASHQFAHRGADVGFFLEASPGYPMLAATALPGHGEAHRKLMLGIARRTVHIALAIDGFHDDVPGGTVRLRPSGAPILDYPIGPRLWEAFRTAQKRLIEIGLASGAKEVATLHDPPLTITHEKDVDRVDQAPWEPCRVGVFTAHQMGGCRMGDDPKRAVVRSEDLRHHQLRNLHVVDGSVFPTSLGVNPQESIYGLARLMATRIAASR
ncbi:MAG: GMC family oxidoreductase [Minicystis sp.]